jgi:hypothetical protein
MTTTNAPLSDAFKQLAIDRYEAGKGTAAYAFGPAQIQAIDVHKRALDAAHEALHALWVSTFATNARERAVAMDSPGSLDEFRGLLQFSRAAAQKERMTLDSARQALVKAGYEFEEATAMVLVMDRARRRTTRVVILRPVFAADSKALAAYETYVQAFEALDRATA